MGQDTNLGKNHPVLVDLRRWMKMRKVRYVDAMELWKVGRTTVYNRLHGKRALGVHAQDALFERLGITRDRFYRGVAAGFHLELVLAEIKAEDSSQVRHLNRYYLSRAPARAYDAEALEEMAAGLEALRFRDPDAAWTQALEILRTPELDPEVEGEAWGVLGVLHRYKGRIAVTAFCFGKAIRVGGSQRLQARTWQRIAMLLLFNVGATGRALVVTRRAGACYRRCGDMVGIGKTLVDEGMILVHSGAYRQALCVYDGALKLLDEEALEHRFGALQGSAITAVYLGDAREAMRRLDEALRVLAGDESSFMYAAILWLKGEICLLLGELRAAAGYFQRVRKRYVGLEMSLELTLISLRLAKAYFLLNDRRRLRAVLDEMVGGLDEIERSNKVLGAAFAEFLGESARGQISAELLEQIYRKLRGEAEAAPHLLPRSLPAPTRS